MSRPKGGDSLSVSIILVPTPLLLSPFLSSTPSSLVLISSAPSLPPILSLWINAPPSKERTLKARRRTKNNSPVIQQPRTKPETPFSDFSMDADHAFPHQPLWTGEQAGHGPAREAPEEEGRAPYQQSGGPTSVRKGPCSSHWGSSVWGEAQPGPWKPSEINWS